WTAIGGTIDAPSSPHAAFTCREEGEQRITIAVSDDGFEHCADDWTVSVVCVDGGGGTGGTGGGFPALPELEDGPNQSEVSDPLYGERTLLAQHDLVIGVKNMSSASLVIGLPTSNGAPDTSNSFDTTFASQNAVFETASARLFNTPQDYVVSVWATESSTTTVTMNVSKWSGDGSLDTVFPNKTIDFGSNVGDSIFVAVDDFNLDGLEDVFVTTGTAGNRGGFFATANDIDNPAAGLSIEPGQGVEPKGIQVPGPVTGDLNGDGIVELILPGECKSSTTTGPADNQCSVSWVSVCPGPIAGNTYCADAGSGWTLVAPPTDTLTVTAPSGSSLGLPSGPGAVAPVVAGNFLEGTQDQIAILFPLISDNVQRIDNVIFGDRQNPTVYLYTFSDTFEPTLVTEQSVWTGTATNGFFLGISMAAGPIDWSSQTEMMALGVDTRTQFTAEKDQITVLAYWDQGAGELRSVFAQGPTNVTAFYDVAVGHFDRPTTGCETTTGSCPESNLNYQMAHLVETDGDQTDLFVWDVTNAGDPGCDSTTDPPYCLSVETHPQVAPLLGSVATEVALVAGDFQGRGVRLGAPTVTRQTSNRPVLVVATPPAHGERLRVQDFDQNLFPTASSTATDKQAWITVSDCHVSVFSEIDADTMCTFDFTIDGNTGNSQYQTFVKETSTNSSMSTTDHRLATSWGGSSTTSAAVNVSEDPDLPLSGYVQASASVSVGRTNTRAQDNISEMYSSSTQTSTFATTFDDVVVYINVTDNVYRYPMLGQICSPSGGNNGCTAERTGLQYYTVSIPNQPTTTTSQGRTLEWFQPPWVPGNIFTYPANCAALAGMYGASASVDNVLVSKGLEVGGSEGMITRTFESNNSNVTKTATGHSIFNDDTVSVSTGIGNAEKPGKDGASITETGNFQDSRDKSTLTNSTTTTSGSSEIIAQWTDSLNWMQSDQFGYSSQLIINGMTSSFASSQIESISTDPLQDANPDDTYVTRGFFSSAYAVSFDDSEWWTDTNKTDYYANNIDVSLALPGRIENTAGGTQPGEGDEAVTQCMDNGSSQKLQCVQMAYVDTSFSDVWGVCGDYFHMRGFFFSPAPSGAPSSTQACSTQTDCPFGEACVGGTCGQCSQSSDCETGQTCANNTCIQFVNGLPSVPGGTADTVIAGTPVLLGVRVYNTSLKDMAAGQTVKVQIYGQKWDGENRATVAGNPVDSFLVGEETIDVGAIDGFPPDMPLQSDGCDPDDAVYNWTGAFTTWDTTGLAPEELETYVFWVLAWAEDSDGNVVGEMPELGLCPEGDCSPCPPDENGNPKCTWMTDVELQTWSNNLGLYRKVFTVLPASTSEPQPLEEVRRGGVVIDGLDIEGVRRVGDPLLVRAHLRAEGGDANGVTVTFFDKDPVLREAADHEAVGHIPEGKPWPVSISYRPFECGSKTVFVEARDDRGFVTRGSKRLDVPCAEVGVEATREIDGGAVPRDGRWESARLVLTIEDAVDVSLPGASLVLERVLSPVWGDELVRTAEGSMLGGVVLTAIDLSSDDEVTYRGAKDGSQVDAIVTREDDALTIDLRLHDVHIRPGLFCTSPGAHALSTHLSLHDGDRARVLVTARDALRCDGPDLVP
ncbi:MAG: hypothetical protein WBG86_08945, partial [Polyangiales bacterium]